MGEDSGGSPENRTDSDRTLGRAEKGGQEGSEPQLKKALVLIRENPRANKI